MLSVDVASRPVLRRKKGQDEGFEREGLLPSGGYPEAEERSRKECGGHDGNYPIIDQSVA
jgi:hypothetical protein